VRTLIVANQLTEETAEGTIALPEEYLVYLAAVTHRLIWCAGADDVVVLPTAPDPGFVTYVWEQKGLTDHAPLVFVPPPGRRGDHLLYDDRLLRPDVVDQLRELVRQRRIETLRPFYFDASMVALANDLGIASGVPGFGFVAQGGYELVNSKSTFRALASGNGIPIPDGGVVDSVTDAVDTIGALLDAGEPAIVKQDVHGGGYGNEILTPRDGLIGYGAERITVLTGRDALYDHVTDAWPRYTHDGRRPVVVERYIDGCIPIYVELFVADQHVTTIGYGEMRMAPTNNGLVIPPPTADLPSFPGFLAHAVRIGEVVRALGYRGSISIDAIVTPGGDVLFNEFNGRIGGSTHIHRIMADHLGSGTPEDRAVIARSRCDMPSVEAAAATLVEAKLAFDPATRTGVVIAGDSRGTPGPSGQCLIIAETAEAATAMERDLIAAMGWEPDR
jgi:hypothetical protein